MLADKGFTIEEDVAIIGANFSTPSIVTRKSQMSFCETKYSRQVPNTRIHIEKIIDSLRMRFNILVGPVNLKFLHPHANNVCFFDQIVRVCFIISNMNQSVVPQE